MYEKINYKKGDKMVFEQKIKTGLEAIGKNGHITNRAILCILENIGGYQSDEAGHGALDVEKNGFSWILLDWKLKVIKRPMYGEELLVKTWGRNNKKVHTYRDFEVYNKNNELCIIATSKMALINIETKKFIKLEDSILSKYKLDDKSVFEEKELKKINIPNEFTRTINYEVTRRNIDYNGHMHNIHYLDLAYEALPEDVYQNRPYNNLRISYKNEIKLGDKVSCNYTYIEGKHIIVIKNDSENIVNSIIELWN